MKPYELIAELMRLEGLGSLPLAKKLSRPGLQAQIYRFSKGQVRNPERTTAVPLAAYFDIPVDAIYDERVATEVARTRGIVSASSVGETAAPYFVVAAPAPDNVREAQTIKRLPIISWVQAGQLEDVQEPAPVSDWATLYDPDRTVGGQAFALRVSGDSMTSPVPGGLPSFPDGTIIIVDPDAGYDPGDFVVAKDVETQQATFKRLMLDGGRWYLKPINPAYPTLAIDQPSLRVIGRVVEFQIRGRL